MCRRHTTIIIIITTIMRMYYYSNIRVTMSSAHGCTWRARARVRTFTTSRRRQVRVVSDGCCRRAAFGRSPSVRVRFVAAAPRATDKNIIIHAAAAVSPTLRSGGRAQSDADSGLTHDAVFFRRPSATRERRPPCRIIVARARSKYRK